MLDGTTRGIPIMRPDVFLQDLSDIAAWERVPDRNGLGRPDAPKPILAEFDELIFANVRAGLQLDDGRDGLTPFLIGDTDDGAILDRRMRPQDLLHLAGV